MTDKVVPSGTSGTVSPPHYSEKKGWHRDLYRYDEKGRPIKMSDAFFNVVPEPLGDLARGMIVRGPSGEFIERMSADGIVERVSTQAGG